MNVNALIPDDDLTITLENERTLRVGDRHWPVSYAEVGEVLMPDIDSRRPIAPNRRRQAVVAFESGWQVSILWGTLSYSDNHDTFYADDRSFTDEPHCVEAGFLWRDEGLVGKPFGYCNAEVLNDMLDLAATFPSNRDIPTEIPSTIREVLLS